MSENAVPKIEGHAAFYAHLKSGQVDKARIIGLENDRFVEKILSGRQYYEAPIITSRICGICPVIHNITSVRAIENACGITPTDQTISLRKLLLCGQMIQSHSLHLYLLVLPDYIGASSSFELQKSHPELFKHAIALKKYADLIVEIIGGRSVHPVTSVPGGFTKLPDSDRLKEIIKAADEIIDIGQKTVELFASLQHPEIKQDLIYSALTEKKEYAFYDGDIGNSEGQIFKSENYTHHIYEELKSYTRSKFGTLKGHLMTVGAISRYNLNRENLEPEVKALAKDNSISDYFTNPFDNIIAQALENYHFILLSKKIAQNLIKEGLNFKEPIIPPASFGKGTAACEAPRGTLFHHYELDKEGYIQKCDIITPTVQSLPALEADMSQLGPIIKDLSVAERNKTIEMLIRSYDPCITCATH